MTNKMEAARYIKSDADSRIPFFGRESTVRFVDFLYRMGAQSVEVSKNESNRYDINFITELYIRVAEQDAVRDILNLMLKSFPSAIEEIAIRLFRIEWTSKHSHPYVVENGYPEF